MFNNNYDKWLQSQPESKSIAKDWKGNEIPAEYDDIYFYIDGEYVWEEELDEWARVTFNMLSTDDILSNARKGV